MYTTKTIRNFGENELNYGIAPNASWHQDYSESAYIFISNLDYNMNEGDIAVVFSQFGETIDVHLVRNKKTGKSRGFCFLAYEDQRSTALAVDNMNGASICGRVARVDHVKQFKPPKEYLELEQDDPEFFNKLYKPSGPDGKGWGQFRDQDEEEKELAERIKQVEQEKVERNEKVLETMNELQQQQKIIDADERVLFQNWEKMLMNDMENENDALIRKIEDLKRINEKLVKKKTDETPKKRIVSETNEERDKKLKKNIKKEEKQKKKKKQKK